MESYTNEKGETKIIAELDDHVLIHAIAKYAELQGKASDVVKALKAEALKRLTERANKGEF